MYSVQNWHEATGISTRCDANETPVGTVACRWGLWRIGIISGHDIGWIRAASGSLQHGMCLCTIRKCCRGTYIYILLSVPSYLSLCWRSFSITIIIRLAPICNWHLRMDLITSLQWEEILISRQSRTVSNMKIWWKNTTPERDLIRLNFSSKTIATQTSSNARCSPLNITHFEAMIHKVPLQPKHFL